MRFHGKHAMIDIDGFITDPTVGGNLVLKLMRDSLSLSSCHEVHHKLVILDGDTPPGFTAVVLIDESHITAHCYSERGWLAIDVFTCGSTSCPNRMVSYIYENIKEVHPTIVPLQRNYLERFPVLKNRYEEECEI